MSLFLEDLPLAEHGIVLRRLDNRDTATNVPHLVIHHSPDGYEWGYRGSGPAELALNLVEWLLRHEGYEGPIVRCMQGACFRLTWELYHDCMRDLLVDCGRGDVTMPLQTVQEWLSVYRLAVEPLTKGA